LIRCFRRRDRDAPQSPTDRASSHGPPGRHSAFAKLENRLVLLAWLNSLLGYETNKKLLEDTNTVADGFGADGRILVPAAQRRGLAEEEEMKKIVCLWIVMFGLCVAQGRMVSAEEGKRIYQKKSART